MRNFKFSPQTCWRTNYYISHKSTAEILRQVEAANKLNPCALFPPAHIRGMPVLKSSLSKVETESNLKGSVTTICIVLGQKSVGSCCFTSNQQFLSPYYDFSIETMIL